MGKKAARWDALLKLLELQAKSEYNTAMITISIDDMQSDLIGYLRRVQAGETLIITQANAPIAEIKPVSQIIKQKAKQLRPFALCKGNFVLQDDFDSPLPDSMI